MKLFEEHKRLEFLSPVPMLILSSYLLLLVVLFLDSGVDSVRLHEELAYVLLRWNPACYQCLFQGRNDLVEHSGDYRSDGRQKDPQVHQNESGRICGERKVLFVRLQIFHTPCGLRFLSNSNSPSHPLCPLSTRTSRCLSLSKQLTVGQNPT